jgi:Ribbon-helix-helix protein, copG family
MASPRRAGAWRERPAAGAFLTDIQATGDRVAFTVRLDRERHRRLKLLAARRGRSRQEMLLRALDAYLEACAIDPGVPPSRKLAAES